MWEWVALGTGYVGLVQAVWIRGHRKRCRCREMGRSGQREAREDPRGGVGDLRG